MYNQMSVSYGMHDHTHKLASYIVHDGIKMTVNIQTVLHTARFKMSPSQSHIPCSISHVLCSMSQASCLEPKGLSQEVSYQLIEMYACVLPRQ